MCVRRKCKICGKEFKTYPSRIKVGFGKYCSWKCQYKSMVGQKSWNKDKTKGNCESIRKMAEARKGKKNWMWKGGIRYSKGYRQILMPHHPFANAKGYIFEHRLVAEKILGRYLKPNEVVHHLDGNKLNNKIENLVPFSSHIIHFKTYHKKKKAR